MHSRRRSFSCQPVRSLWISPDHGAAQAGRLAGRQGSRGAYLPSRGAEGSTETKATGQVVAQRRIVRATKAGAAEPVWSYDFVSARTHMMAAAYGFST